MDSELKVVSGTEFLDETVQLDGIEFRDCSFRRCELTYAGGLPFLLTNSPADDCSIVFVDAAQATMDALSVMYQTGLHDFVETLFGHVRNPLSDSVQ